MLIACIYHIYVITEFPPNNSLEHLLFYDNARQVHELPVRVCFYCQNMMPVSVDKLAILIAISSFRTVVMVLPSC